jgi:hypothetical protein
MIETGIYEGRQVSLPGINGPVEDYGWQEHSTRRVSQRSRTHMKEALRSQGFWLE